jgi:WhiB family redox-sensing transcriptional regulator
VSRRYNKAGPGAQWQDPTAAIALLADLDAEELDWQDQALCAQTDPEAFFPEKGCSTREAKKVCRSCDVRAECLEYALTNGERFGIWGGLSERERRRLQRDVSLSSENGDAEPAAEAA